MSSRWLHKVRTGTAAQYYKQGLQEMKGFLRGAHALAVSKCLKPCQVLTIFSTTQGKMPFAPPHRQQVVKQGLFGCWRAAVEAALMQRLPVPDPVDQAFGTRFAAFRGVRMVKVAVRSSPALQALRHQLASLAHGCSSTVAKFHASQRFVTCT